jgi:hypothetical protein
VVEVQLGDSTILIKVGDAKCVIVAILIFLALCIVDLALSRKLLIVAVLRA